MTRVLLIADTERVQRIFRSLEERGVLQLQTVSTLELGESELAASRYDFTFVQSRISGFSGIILLRHLDKILPEKAQLVLLSGDAEDAARAKKHGRQSLDLAMEDDLLSQALLAAVTGALPPETPPAEDSRTADSTPAKTADTPPAPGNEPPAREAAKPGRAAEEPPPVEPPPGGEASSPFEEAIARASANLAPTKVLEVEDRVDLGNQRPGTDRGAQAGAGEEPVSPGRPVAVETLAEALRRAEKKKSRRPYLFILPALVLIAIPLVSHLAGRNAGTGPEGAPAARPEVSAPAPEAKGPAAPETAQPQQPVTQPPAKPAPKRGLASLPPILEGTRFDPDYGKSNPGWVRYEGLRAEYKLFREDDLFKAIQVVARGGGTVSDAIFQRMLREFGGVDSYRVESTSSKGDYLVEQCSTGGDAALTIYRNSKSLKIKGFVIYYR